MKSDGLFHNANPNILAELKQQEIIVAINLKTIS